MQFLKKTSKKSAPAPQTENMSVWAGALAHEIRNPLNTMRLNIDLLKEDWYNPDFVSKEKVEKRFDTLVKEIGRLESILNDFLRLARLPKPNFEKSNILLLINELLDFSEPEAQQLNICVKREFGDELPEIYIDKNQIKQALLNIILNAYQAMPDGGDVVIKAHKLDSSVTIEITDYGDGIPKEKQEKIFDLFYSTKEDGTGLGLPISKRIIEMHNGSIYMESEKGNGTTFHITLPIRANE